MKKILLILCFLPLLTICQNQRKIALVIGNANYEDPNGLLKNPINDSKLMSETFTELEFDSVIVANDLSFVSMREVFRNYRSSLKSFDVGFIYYSGHGMQDAYNETYLIPIDFPANSTIDDVTNYGYSIQDILRSLNRYENKLNVFVLDACRDNPYEKGWKGKSIKGVGLSEPQVPPTGSLVAYSTSPGDVASDNSELDNSLYTKALSEIMKEPNLKIEEIFKRVRNVVYSESEQIQNPQWWGQLEGDLYLLLKENTKVISLEKELKNAFKKLYKYEDYLKTVDEQVSNDNDPNNIGNLDLLEFFNSTSKYAKVKEKDLYILSLFGIMKTGFFASDELNGHLDATEADDYAQNKGAEASYELYRVLSNTTDDELKKILDNNFIKPSVQEFRIRVKFGYLLYTLTTQGQTKSFNYDELKKLISNMYCAKKEFNTSQSLLFIHILQQYLTHGYIQKGELSCLQKPTKKKLDIYKYLSEISENLNENTKSAYVRLPVLSEIFRDYYNLCKSNNITSQNMYNTSYGFYFVSYNRAKNTFLQNYSTILNGLDFKLIKSLEESEYKEQLLVFLRQEIDMVNEIGDLLYHTYFEEFQSASYNYKNYEFNIFSDCFKNIASVNNNFYLSNNTDMGYQYQFLLFSKYLTKHYRVMAEGIEKTKHFYLEDGWTENELEDVRLEFSNLENSAMLHVYAGAFSFADSTKFNVTSLKQESKKFLDEYFYNLVENNDQSDSLMDDKIIDYVYYKSRNCLLENEWRSVKQFECFSDIASLLDEFDLSKEYNSNFYDNKNIDVFWKWYNDCDLTCDSTLTKDELYHCRVKNASLESKKKLDYIKFYNEKFNGLGNGYCILALSELLTQQLYYLFEEDAFIHKVNDYIFQYTQSFIDLTILRSNIGSAEYLNYTTNDLNTFFAVIDYIIDFEKINSSNKQLIVGGILYKLDQFIANFTFSEQYDSLRDLLQNRIDESQVSLNKKINIQR